MLSTNIQQGTAESNEKFAADVISLRVAICLCRVCACCTDGTTVLKHLNVVVVKLLQKSSQNKNFYGEVHWSKSVTIIISLIRGGFHGEEGDRLVICEGGGHQGWLWLAVR